MLVVHDGVVGAECVIGESFKGLTCPCGDVGMTVVVRPIYLGLDG